MIQYDVFSQIIDPIDAILEKPRAKCTILVENSEKIKELDARTCSNPLLRSELIQNRTRLKAALAKVIDSILEFKAEDLGLYDVTTGELAEKSSTMNIDTAFPQYDYSRRLWNLANTTFSGLIEYDGREWFIDQDLAGFDRMQEDNINFYRSLRAQPVSGNRKERIVEVIRLFPDSTAEQYKDVLLFKKKSQIKGYLAE